MATPREGYERNVFINCPFDEPYHQLLRPLLFTIVFLGFSPKIASETSDAGELRLNKICRLIQESRYSIHDLSRLQASRSGEHYRMNMPFELGIEYGCRLFAENHLRDKRCLILSEERYEYMKAVSDLAGIDIKAHQGEPKNLTRRIRNWFVETVGLRRIASPTDIWYKFGDFMTAFNTARKEEGFSEEDLRWMPIPEYVDFIQEWLKKHDQ